MAELTIGLVLPDVLGTYGDDGNALVLRQRARLRGVSAEIHSIRLGEAVPDSLDVYTLGGGEDTAQLLAAEHLIADGGLSRAAAAGRPVLGVCAGLQVLGESFHAGGRVASGVGLLDATTSQLKSRMIGEIVARPTESALSAIAGARSDASVGSESPELLTGFANHMGATILGSDAAPLGVLAGNRTAVGNTDEHGLGDGDSEQLTYEGAVQGSVVATYMHGPVLARNPQLADALLAKAMGVSVASLPELNAPQLAAEVTKLRRERLA